ncbi:37S ribosomal protein, mitochondrial [Xylographa parallela]|nr:37S ribosomal protein, mitochondrial [Xylographa parallela]
MLVLQAGILQRATYNDHTAFFAETGSLTTEVDTLEASVENSLKETHSIESLIQDHTLSPIPRINDKTHRTFDYKKDETVRKHLVIKHQSNQYFLVSCRSPINDCSFTDEVRDNLGSEVAPHYQPHQLITNPPSPSQITLELLLASQSHLGHSTSLWNPMNSRYIFGIRQGIHIISLDVTASHLRRACRIVSGVAERAGLILFVGSRPGQDRCVVNAAKLAGGCHLFERWIPGSITNGNQILGGCQKKVVDEHDNEIEGHDDHLLDQPALKPDLVVCLNPLENWVMLHECGLNNIPTIGIIDTDADPTWVTYPIPANDDSLRCVQVIAGVLGKAGQEGQLRRMEKAKKGEISYQPVDLGGDNEEDDDDEDDHEELIDEIAAEAGVLIEEEDD